jgi:hypothetical protein
MVCVEYGNMGSWSTIDEMIAEYSTVSTKQNKRNKRALHWDETTALITEPSIRRASAAVTLEGMPFKTS